MVAGGRGDGERPVGAVVDGDVTGGVDGAVAAALAVIVLVSMAKIAVTLRSADHVRVGAARCADVVAPLDEVVVGGTGTAVTAVPLRAVGDGLRTAARQAAVGAGRVGQRVAVDPARRMGEDLDLGEPDVDGRGAHRVDAELARW